MARRVYCSFVVGTLAFAAAALAGCASSKARRSGEMSTVPQARVTERGRAEAPSAPVPAISRSPAAETTVQRAAYEPAPAGDRAPAPAEIVLAPTPLESDRPPFSLDLATALGFTQGQNPRIAFAQAQIAQAYAEYDRAQVLWLPSIRGGMNYNKHEGRIQDVVGTNIETSRGAAYGGLGASAVGAGSPAVPGVYALFHTTDAIYQRQITGFALDAREFQSTAVQNDQLLETALAYLALLEAAQRKAITAETFAHGEELARLTQDFARTGAGNLADADRASAAVALLQNEVVRAEEAAFVASARVAQQISADPALMIVPQEPNVVPIHLVPIEGTLTTDLVALGLSNRPELAANRSLVCEAVSRLRREEHAPWLPSVLLGVSYGAFAAGTGSDITNGADRFDFDAAAWWEVRNLGFGEVAARNNARAQIMQARMREVETLDLVAREVVEAHAQVTARHRQIEVARQAIAAAHRSYDRNLERIRNAQGLPIEVLQSIQALDAARREYLRAVIDYNTAQFRLQRALGWPISG
jgi:outer membrane protein TolC